MKIIDRIKIILLYIFIYLLYLLLISIFQHFCLSHYFFNLSIKYNTNIYDISHNINNTINNNR